MGRMTAHLPGAQSGRAGEMTPALARPGRTWLWALLLLPGGLIFALGLGIAWAGLVLLLPGLRRMAAAVGGPSVAPVQPHGEQDEPSPRQRPQNSPTPEQGPQRVPWAACGEHGSSTGQPPVWLAPPSREAN
jgi:hypothetical protein